MSDHEFARSKDQRQHPSFMDRVRALRSEHALCIAERNGQNLSALHATTTDDRVILCCGRCRASWTFVLSASDAIELEAYVKGRRQQQQQGEGDGPQTS
jgi:hypothetical protein